MKRQKFHAKYHSVTEEQQCKEGENRNEQLRYGGLQRNLIMIVSLLENWTQTVNTFDNEIPDNSPENMYEMPQEGGRRAREQNTQRDAAQRAEMTPERNFQAC
jgi:hypothetical protein